MGKQKDKSDKGKNQTKIELRQIESKIDMIEAMNNNFGIVSIAAQKAGISRNTHYRWLEEDPGYEKDSNEALERAKDFVESKIYQAIQEGKESVLIHYAKTKMRDRGYGEKISISGDPDAPLHLNLSALTFEQLKALKESREED